jgi:hypothetical protein
MCFQLLFGVLKPICSFDGWSHNRGPRPRLLGYARSIKVYFILHVEQHMAIISEVSSMYKVQEVAQNVRIRLNRL